MPLENNHSVSADETVSDPQQSTAKAEQKVLVDDCDSASAAEAESSTEGHSRGDGHTDQQGKSKIDELSERIAKLEESKQQRRAELERYSQDFNKRLLNLEAQARMRQAKKPSTIIASNARALLLTKFGISSKRPATQNTASEEPVAKQARND